MRLIDADALKECVIEPSMYDINTRDVIDLIDEQPTIDAVPVVHAKWVGGKYYNDVYGYEKTCTACQTEYVVGFDYLYCPYCGAKMDGEDA